MLDERIRRNSVARSVGYVDNDGWRSIARDHDTGKIS